MAELVVSPIVESVIGTLGSALLKELGLLCGTGDDLEKLGSTLAEIKDVLEDAERRSIADRPLRNWLLKLKDVAYDADDVMDEFRTEALRRRAEGYDGSFKRKVREFFSPSNNPIVFRGRIAHEIKNVLERVDGIARERGQFMLTAAEPIPQRYDDERVTTSSLVERKILGREDDVEKVVSFLTNEEEKEKDLSVLPIVGMGGIGKTTLARWVYHDVRVRWEFDLRMWVCVSEIFDVKEITKTMIECINNKSPCLLSNLEPMQQLLQESLNGKRFLLILDDVWNEDVGKWEILRSILRGGKLGSKIVVTTRSRISCTIMGTVLPHELSGLNMDLCWILFKERAFGLGREQETPNLVEIGMKIVEKCGGLPLAAKALGSLMASRRGEAEWLAIENSEIWKLPRDENSVLPSLRLSYHHLPSDLKRCFAYCSSFPKDYNFDKATLIWLWISEGFIPPVDGGMDPEDTGNNYFNSLLWRSFFQDVEEDEDDRGRVTCKMHDLMHDLACDVAGGEFSRAIVGQEIKQPENCRYLSLTTNSESTLPNILGKIKKVRSLRLIPSDPDGIFVELDMLLRLKHLRILDLGGCEISVLPTEINILKHLRFLDLTGASFKRLPDTIGNLYNLFTLILKYCHELEELPSTINRLQNLHTLDLSGCGELRELPGGMSSMKNLRHLDVFECDKMTKMTPCIGQLTKLKTLTKFIVGEEDGHRITELQNLNGISGRLEISGLHKVQDPVEAEEANLAAKIHVKVLGLEWDSEIEGENLVHVFESLRCPPNLQALTIEEYNGTGFPNWIMSRDTQASLFKSLAYVFLGDLPRCEWLPPLGQLPSLERLSILGMPGVRRISEEFYYGQTTETVAGSSRGTFPFAQLEYLSLDNLVNLEEWVVEAGDLKREQMFPNLVSLDIEDCPKLKVNPDWPVIKADGWRSKGLGRGFDLVSLFHG